jgi:hypothetical protein
MLATYLKTPETLKNTVSPSAMVYLVGNCGGCLAGRSGKGPATRERRRNKRFMLGREWRRESILLRPCSDSVVWRCDTGRGGSYSRNEWTGGFVLINSQTDGTGYVGLLS